jgi:hypothetical protein
MAEAMVVQTGSWRADSMAVQLAESWFAGKESSKVRPLVAKMVVYWELMKASRLVEQTVEWKVHWTAESRAA